MATIKEVELARVYAAPADAVWDAWTDPRKLRGWWGPENVIITDCQVELRVGGRFFIVMEADKEMGAYAGMRWPMEATFTAVEPKVRLAYTAIAWTEGQKDETLIDQTTEVIFRSMGAQTEVRVKAAIHRLGPKAGMAADGMRHGFTQQQEKLAVYLSQKSS
jgi:uncharacterized protein YndB with AHSA1/START domain